MVVITGTQIRMWRFGTRIRHSNMMYHCYEWLPTRLPATSLCYTALHTVIMQKVSVHTQNRMNDIPKCKFFADAKHGHC